MIPVLDKPGTAICLANRDHSCEPMRECDAIHWAKGARLRGSSTPLGLYDRLYRAAATMPLSNNETPVPSHEIPLRTIHSFPHCTQPVGAAPHRSTPIINFPPLPPGRLVLRVLGCMNNKGWLDELPVLSLPVVPTKLGANGAIGYSLR